MPTHPLRFIFHFAAAAMLSALAIAQQPVNVALSSLQVQVARLAPGNSQGELTFQVDTATSLLFQFEASLHNLQIAVTTPAGQIISADNASSVGGEYLEFDDIAASQSLFSFPFSGTNSAHYALRLPSLGGGAYTVQLSRASGTDSDEAVVGELLSDSRLRAALFCTEMSVPAGHRTVVTAAVFDGNNPVANAKIEAHTRNAEGVTTTVALADNGVAPDQIAGDGLFSGTLVEVEPGTYEISAEITGMNSVGQSFARDTGTTLTVVPMIGSLTGPVLDQPIGSNNASFQGISRIIALPIRIRTRRLVGGGMTTIFGFMTDDLT